MSLSSHKQPLHICITGSAQGVGASAAKTLIGQGHVVYHACRTLERAQQAAALAGGGIPMECDLADLDSVQKFAKQLEQQAVRLDILCLNAGVAPYSKATQPRLTRQGTEECIGVNHIGHFLLANLLYPKLVADGGGRLVVTASSVHDPQGAGGSSQGVAATLGNLSGFGVNLIKNPNGPTMVNGSVVFNGMKCYKDSKLCNILFVKEAVKRFPDVQVRTFTPGFIPTTGLFQPMRDNAWWTAQALTWMGWLAGFAVDVNVGGDRLVYMALGSDNEIPNGSYFYGKGSGTTKETGFVPTPVSEEGSDESLAARLWDASHKVVQPWLE